jgi:hypothetical protein
MSGTFADLRALYQTQNDTNKIKVLDALHHFLVKKEIKVADQVPIIDGRLIDLCALYHQTQLKGGSEAATQNNRWSEIATQMGYANARGRGIDVLLQRVFFQFLRAFEHHIWISKYGHKSQSQPAPTTQTQSSSSTPAPPQSSNNNAPSNSSSAPHPSNKRPRPSQPSSSGNSATNSNSTSSTQLPHKQLQIGDSNIKSAIVDLYANNPSVVIYALNILTQKSIDVDQNALFIEKYPIIIVALGDLLNILNPLSNILQIQAAVAGGSDNDRTTPYLAVSQYYSSRIIDIAGYTKWSADSLNVPLIQVNVHN